MTTQKIVDLISQTLRDNMLYGNVNEEQYITVATLFAELKKAYPDKVDRLKEAWNIFKVAQADEKERNMPMFYKIDTILLDVTGYKTSYLETLERLENVVKRKKKNE